MAAILYKFLEICYTVTVDNGAGRVAGLTVNKPIMLFSGFSLGKADKEVKKWLNYLTQVLTL